MMLWVLRIWSWEYTDYLRNYQLLNVDQVRVFTTPRAVRRQNIVMNLMGLPTIMAVLTRARNNFPDKKDSNDSGILSARQSRSFAQLNDQRLYVELVPLQSGRITGLLPYHFLFSKVTIYIGLYTLNIRVTQHVDCGKSRISNIPTKINISKFTSVFQLSSSLSLHYSRNTNGNRERENRGKQISHVIIWIQQWRFLEEGCEFPRKWK
jgi:hypothetical protein